MATSTVMDLRDSDHESGHGGARLPARREGALWLGEHGAGRGAQRPAPEQGAAAIAAAPELALGTELPWPSECERLAVRNGSGRVWSSGERYLRAAFFETLRP